MQRVKRSTAVAVLPNPPEGGTPGYFAAPNPQGGIDATVPGYEWFNAVQEEICAVVEAAGIALDEGDRTQLVAALIKKGMQGNHFSIATAAGTADAITGVFVPAVVVLTNGMKFHVRAGSANTSATPTFTPAPGTIAAKTIVKGNNLPLVPGDIAGAGHWVVFQYDEALDKWVMENPATGASNLQNRQIQSITATVAANALTLGLQPTSLDFRATPLTSGSPNRRTLAAALSLVVPSGATLGTVSAQPARLVLLAIDNAGTVELAVANLAGGLNLDETTLISTTAISGAANSANVIYSTTARASVPFRVVGFIDITEAVAGTWATAPTKIQGQGGQALAAVQSIGYGQTWQNVLGSRSTGTTYYNTTGRPIMVVVGGAVLAAASYGLALMVNGTTLGGPYNSTNATGSAGSVVSAIVPPGSSYSVVSTGGATPTYWAEMR